MLVEWILIFQYGSFWDRRNTILRLCCLNRKHAKSKMQSLRIPCYNQHRLFIFLGLPMYIYTHTWQNFLVYCLTVVCKEMSFEKNTQKDSYCFGHQESGSFCKDPTFASSTSPGFSLKSELHARLPLWCLHLCPSSPPTGPALVLWTPGEHSCNFEQTLRIPVETRTFVTSQLFKNM